MQFLRSLALRFKEPSSWAGLAALATLFGVTDTGPVMEWVSLLGAGLAGALAFLIPEQSAPKA